MQGALGCPSLGGRLPAPSNQMQTTRRSSLMCSKAVGGQGISGSSSSQQTGPLSTSRPLLAQAPVQPPQLILPPGVSASRNGSSSVSSAGVASTSGRGSVSAAAAAASTSVLVEPVVAAGKTLEKDALGTPMIYLHGQRIHSLHAQGLDVIRSLDGWASTELQRYLKPATKCWQPADFLPDPASPDFFDQVNELRKRSADLPADYLVVLVGDMVTEEALPSYMNMLNTLDGTKDETGAQAHGWAVWTRHWTSEENRHGDLLNKYLYLGGRVDMHSIETTIQRLIGAGLDPQLENNPYLCFVYTSFQERATKISHGNTARLAGYYGDQALAKICGIIAADEGRHEAAYQEIVAQLFQRDPEGAILAFADMMKKGIVMPAHLVDDGLHGERNKGANLFLDYATVADNIGVYTTQDYANIVEHLIKRWRVAELQHLGGEAAAAQEFVMAHPARIRRLANIQAERRLRDKKRGKVKEASFSWVHGRVVGMQ